MSDKPERIEAYFGDDTGVTRAEFLRIGSTTDGGAVYFAPSGNGEWLGDVVSDTPTDDPERPEQS